MPNDGSGNALAGKEATPVTSSSSLTGAVHGHGQTEGSPGPSINDDGDEEEEHEGDGENDVQESDGEDIEFRVRDEPNTASADAGTSANTDAMNRPEQQHSPATTDFPGPINSAYNIRNNHARRLNTEEEIKLFELCNKNAATFGERSKLCEWWKNIADEFVRTYGGPYSWHSVRRKVDLVTKQRIKYLADLKNGIIAQDQATEPWRKVLDEWIPTWENFENAEKRRIEVRDAKAATRKRKEPPTAASGSNTPTAATAATAAAAVATPPGVIPWQATPQRWAPYMPPGPYGPLGPSALHPPPHMGPPPQHYPQQPGLKMPEGYETMFRGPHPTHPMAGGPGGFPSYPPPHMMPPPTPSSPSPAGLIPASQPDQTPSHQQQQQQQLSTSESSLTSAVLETLVKLNKHLEKSSGTSSSPIIAALTGGATTNNNHNKDDNRPSGDNKAANAEAETLEESRSETAPSSPSPATNTKPQTLYPFSSSSSSTITITTAQLTALKNELRQEFRQEFQLQLEKVRESFTSKLDSLEQAQEMILDMLRQEPGREEVRSLSS
ncbi:hypothetical protein UA08_05905 [Talaromyces atroroseus]|uniref:Uncharacterized protein n=1 Tax=Talaromyces atroroseus TaxID=1441469 RepID=A0A225AW89_TALAT|nr:hypothetical protein UA08_05905 [Talaromyces atroroseus]OKL59226.1 hypothetical protein UA08_05905 [Talaromyces atroroseus]